MMQNMVNSIKFCIGSPFCAGPSLPGLATVSVLLFEKDVEPAVNRQPGFRRELVEQITLFIIHSQLEVKNWINTHEGISMMGCKCWFCSTSSRRKPGWRFTAGSTYRTAVNWRHLGPAKIHDNGRYFYVFRDLSYQELLVCYIQIIYIILKFDFVWLSASVLDQTFVNNRGDSSPKWWKMMKFSKNINSSKILWLPTNWSRTRMSSRR